MRHMNLVEEIMEQDKLSVRPSDCEREVAEYYADKSQEHLVRAGILCKGIPTPNPTNEECELFNGYHDIARGRTLCELARGFYQTHRQYKMIAEILGGK